MFTHFCMKENGTAFAFTMTDCEECGADAQVNGFTVVGISHEVFPGSGAESLRQRLLARGYTEVSSLPSELGHDEEKGMAICDDCA